ncbi:MAG: hypothetical protein WBQ69_08780 [Gallionella sp.]
MESKPSSADRISIINALMQQDREEIRFLKNILFNATIVFVSGFVGISAYFINLLWNTMEIRSAQIYLPIVAIWMLVLFYMIIFLFLMKFLRDTRKCLDIREQYYKPVVTLTDERLFLPLKSIEDAGLTSPSIGDDYLLGLLIVTLTAAIANSAAVYYILSNLKFLH